MRTMCACGHARIYHDEAGVGMCEAFDCKCMEFGAFPTIWTHCTPNFLAYGGHCSSTPRRSCQCDGTAGHDHLVDAFWAEHVLGVTS